MLFTHHETVAIGLMEETTPAHRDYPDDIPVGCLVFYEPVKRRPSRLLKSYPVPNLCFLPKGRRRCPFRHHVLTLFHEQVPSLVPTRSLYVTKRKPALGRGSL